MRVSHIAILLVTVVALEGCKSCAVFNPAANNPDNPDTPDDQGADSGKDGDSGDTGPIDTSPPPPCDFPETEDNDNWSQAEELPLDTWSCGVIGEQDDRDLFRLDLPEAGWYRAWVRAADFGSNADMQLNLTDSSQDISASQIRSPGSTDPEMVVPLPMGGSWYATLGEQYSGYGNDHEWEFILNKAKVPLDWDSEEADDNGALSKAQPIENGERIFGTIDSGTDRDWFSFEVEEGKTSFDIRVEAWNYGSPLDAWVFLYTPDEEAKCNSDRGDNSTDPDPILTCSGTEAGTWYAYIKNDDGAGVGDLYWYVIDITWDTAPLDE